MTPIFILILSAMLLIWDFQFRLLSNSMPRYSTLSLHSSEEKRWVLLSISLVNLWSHVFLYHVNNVKKLSWVHFTKATLRFKQNIIFVKHVLWTVIHHFLKNATNDGQQWSRSAITRIRFIATFIDGWLSLLSAWKEKLLAQTYLWYLPRGPK